jgi:hypothetical protein
LKFRGRLICTISTPTEQSSDPNTRRAVNLRPEQIAAEWETAVGTDHKWKAAREKPRLSKLILRLRWLMLIGAPSWPTL